MKYTDLDFEQTVWTIKDGDFYVSSIGNDTTGDGSPQNPFHSLGRALDHAAEGEKIVVDQYQYQSGGNITLSSSRGSLLNAVVATTDNLALNGTPIIDGYQTQSGDRILVWQQLNAAQNGLYIANAGSWTRDRDFDHGDDLTSGMLVSVQEGTLYGNEIFQLHTSFPVIMGNTALQFQKVGKVVWGQIQGNIAAQNDVIVLVDSKIAELKGNPTNAGDTLEKLENRLVQLDQEVVKETNFTDAINALKDGAPVQGDTLNKLYQLIINKVGVSAKASNITARDGAKVNLEDQQNIYVEDASADASVNTGWAIYKYLAQPDTFVKIAEQESLDVQLLQGGSGITIDGTAIDLGGTLTKDLFLEGTFGVELIIVCKVYVTNYCIPY
jgi:hypothetical protein